MDNDLKTKLAALDSERLADALVELAAEHAGAKDVVDRLTATPTENAKRFKARVRGLKRSQRFIPYGESGDFARRLIGILEMLEASKPDPQSGVDLVSAFFETDDATLSRCDDSNGSIGDAYRAHARQLFVHYASLCDDKPKIVHRVVQLARRDDYGVRDCLVESASEYLSEGDIRTMIDSFRQDANAHKDDLTRNSALMFIECLARQIKDAPLYEKTRREHWGKLNSRAYTDIGRVYLEAGDPNTALAWAQRDTETAPPWVFEREALLLDIHEALGDREACANIAERAFHQNPTTTNLKGLLRFVGHEQRDTIVDNAIRKILDDAELSIGDLSFLIELERVDDAERYVIDRAAQLDGDRYYLLPSIAKHFEQHDRALAATAVYRALLDSILKRGRSKTYHHGARYWNKLAELTQRIADWEPLASHDDYVSAVKAQHGRKHSFWAKV